MLSKAACQICGTELQERERLLGVCRASNCQLTWASRLQALRKAELQRNKRERTRLAEAYRDRKASRSGLGELRALQPVVVPANLRKIVKLPERRKRAFRDHLTNIISQAVAQQANSADPPTGETAADSTPPPPALAALMGRGCATCRGRCCNGGGDHAYLSVETILGYMHHHPRQSPQDVLEEYISRLPEKAYKDSCVYQTASGCALPREMRGKISGDFFCEELRQFRDQYYAEGERKVIFYAFEESKVVRTEPFAEPARE
jgi:hypothetical protein